MINAENLTPRITKGAQTSLRIQEAAVDLVIKNGIDGTTVEQICKVANVSQRTFFNHFKTKELAVIGDDLPRIDETKAREFLAAPPGDIFTDAMQLIPGPELPANFHSLVFKRLEMLRKYPELFATHMAKLLATKDQHAELIYLRMKRSYGDTYSEEKLRQLAGQISEIVASLFRSQIEQQILNPGSPTVAHEADLGQTLKTLLELGLKA